MTLTVDGRLLCVCVWWRLGTLRSVSHGPGLRRLSLLAMETGKVEGADSSSLYTELCPGCEWSLILPLYHSGVNGIDGISFPEGKSTT